jgi:class 3 adenylate cyclase
VVSAAASRKTVSVLFCDLAGSTALGERLDPELLRELMASWYESMRTVVESHGGKVEKFVGDAVMAVFGLPRTHEDDALRAVRAAIEMREAASEFVLRIGVNTGVVITGDEATTLVTGDAVNTAKRLEQAANGGEILVGAVTERLIRHAVELEQVESVDAKGKRDPVAAWRVVGLVAGAEPFARRSDIRLVGRRKELAVLRDELRASIDSRSCRLVTVVGTAGLGKTRLTSELAAEVQDYATVLTGRCLAYGDGITYWPLAELLRAFGGEDAVAEAVSDDPDADLVAERLGTLAAGGDGPAEELFWAARRLFEALGRRRPLVIVLEDIHWAEATLLDLVEHVSRWSQGSPILLLCIARPDLLEERPRWEGTIVRLDPLSADESSELLEALDSSGVLSPELRARVADKAQGNPLYAEQLVAMLAESDGDSELAELPPTIQALLAARLDRLEPFERDVLERASVVGKNFWPSAVVALNGGSPVGATLLDLVRRELVEPAASMVPGEDGFSFRHALIRDAAYASAPLRRRAAHHERFAGWLASGSFGEEFEEIRGYHLEQAVRLRRELGMDDEHTEALANEAYALLAQAGRRAYARGDAPAAVTMLERALALDGSDLDLRRLLAQALWDAGEAERAVELFEAVVADAAASGDRAQEWYARLDAVVVRGLTDILETASQAVGVFSELDDERGLSEAWRRIGRAELFRCSYAACCAASERALHYALRREERQAVARAADVLATALLWGPEPIETAIPRCEQLLAHADGNDPLRGNVLIALAGLRALEADFGEARRLRDESEAIYSDLGLQMHLAGMTEIAAQVEFLAGDAAAAEAQLRKGLALLAGKDGAHSALHNAWLASALTAGGRHDEARERAEAARDAASPAQVLAQVHWRGALARVEAAAGNLDVALELARDAVERAAVTDGLAMRAESLHDLGIVLTAAGETEEAARVEREAAALYALKGRVG